LQITDIGIVMQSADGKDFRVVSLKDVGTKASSPYKVIRSLQPYLWKQVEKAERQNEMNNLLPGNIEIYNGLDIVVFEGESPLDAYEKQKWKLKDKKIISLEEARKKAMASQGYVTDKNVPGSISHEWYPLDDGIAKIKFRHYHKARKAQKLPLPYFEWTDWYQVF
jgi:hypothetical protein